MIRVLYVDDEPLLLDICKQFVEVPGEIALDTALSAADAEEALLRKDYDVIISDYQMPDVDGIVFLKRLRLKHGRIPFILFTGRGREEVAIEALNSGADFYLQKGGEPTVQFGQLRKSILQLAKSHAMERSLAFSQRKYFNLMEEANVAAVILDPEMRVTYVNPFGVRLLGWGNDLVGLNFIDWLDMSKAVPDDHPRNIFMAMFATREKGETFTQSFRTKEGDLRWVAWTCRFVRNEIGTVEEVLLQGTDITEAKQNETKLHSSLALLRAAFDSTEEGIVVTNMDHRVTQFNKRFLEMWNIPSELLERSDEGGLMTHVGDQLPIPALFHEFMGNIIANPLEEKRWTVEFTDGRKFEGHTKPVMQEQGAIGRFWSFQDVTSQTKREKAFQAREEDILALFDDNKANMMIIDPDSGRIVYANKAACEFYGYDKDAILSMKITDINIMCPEQVAAEMISARSEKKKYFTFQHRLADGTVRDVEVFSGPIQFEGHKLLFSLVHDISEMERAKRMVEESELRHNRVLNSLAIGILASDATGRLVYANKTVQEMLRSTLDELIGRSPVDLIADEMKELARKNVATRSKGEQGTANYRFKRGDGSELWVQVTGVPLFDQGAYAGTIASVVDISEQRHDAELIEESERKFREIFNSMRDAVMIHEPGGMFLEVNDVACRRFGYTREEMLSIRPEQLDTPDTAGAVPDKMRMILENGSAIFESRHRTNDGRTIPAEINAIVIDYKGKPAILVACRDITERKLSEESLARANEKLKILNSITRHDIMNQLMVLKGNLDIAKTREKDVALIERLGKIGASADIINSQLLFAKDYQEMGTSSPKWQNIGHLISQLPDVREIRKLEFDKALDQLYVYADPMLAKVFHNIMEDTVKYADRHPWVKICMEKKEHSLVIVYEDHGPGIPPEEKERIFEMGFGKGTGLGLHLSVEILSITDIRIRENGEPGKGVRFEIEVPAGMFRFENDSDQINSD